MGTLRHFASHELAHFAGHAYPPLAEAPWVVELVESAWGDWWTVHDGVPVAVHVRSGSRAQSDARRNARRLYPGEPITVRLFNAARAASASRPDQP